MFAACFIGCGCKCCIAEDETIGFADDPTQSFEFEDLNNFLLLDFYYDDDLDAKDGAFSNVF